MRSKMIYLSIFMAVVLGAPGLLSAEHSCESYRKEVCGLCGDDAEICVNAKEAEKECKAKPEYCPVKACAPALEALKRMPPQYRQKICTEDAG